MQQWSHLDHCYSRGLPFSQGIMHFAKMVQNIFFGNILQKFNKNISNNIFSAKNYFPLNNHKN
jgi:hypothetical protein